jgi:hypothetical protein
MTIPMRLFFKGVIKKAVLQDLNDIKAVVEAADIHAACYHPHARHGVHQAPS